MLRLSGKMLYQYDNAYIQDTLKIFFSPTPQRFMIIYNSKAYECEQDGSFLIWAIPAEIHQDPLKLKLQVLDPNTNATDYLTNEITVKRFESSLNNLGDSVEFDKDYPVFSMRDEHDVIPITNRIIKMPKNYFIAVSNDSQSQLLTFEMDRYQDNIDMSKKACSFEYKNAKKEDGRAIAVNVFRSDKRLTVSWLLDSNVTAAKGDVTFAVKFVGTHESGQPYRWSTLPATFKVEEGLEIDDTIFQTEFPSVIEDLQIALVNREEELIRHNTSPDSHIDIRELINDLQPEPPRDFTASPIDLTTEITGILPVTNIDIASMDFIKQSAIDTHDTSPTAHQDIRDDILAQISTALGGISLSQLAATVAQLRIDVDTLL